MPAKQRISTSVTPMQSAVPVQIVKSEVSAPAAAPAPAPATVLGTPAAAPLVKKATAPKKKKLVVTAPAPEMSVPTPLVEAPDTVETLLEENAEDIVETITEEGVPGVEKKRTRRVATKETLRVDFDNLWTEYAEELSAKKKSGKKLSLEKYLHKLQTDVYKLLKIRPLGDEKKPRAENNSGFMKPVNISPELANFINVDGGAPITRVTITKKICEYIKEKDLQNPKDRREIVPDATLKRIFNLTDAEKEPLTYYSMQKKIQSHIFKV